MRRGKSDRAVRFTRATPILRPNLCGHITSEFKTTPKSKFPINAIFAVAQSLLFYAGVAEFGMLLRLAIQGNGSLGPVAEWVQEGGRHADLPNEERADTPDDTSPVRLRLPPQR